MFGSKAAMQAGAVILGLCLALRAGICNAQLPDPTGKDPLGFGTIGLSVNATDVNHQIFGVHEQIPLRGSGRLTLLYPEWETASHAPSASVAELAGLVIEADKKRIEWHRDPVATHSFRFDVARGTKTLDIRFQFAAPASSALLRNQMVVIPWHRVLLYPEGKPMSALHVVPELTIPEGLRAFTSLAVEHAQANHVCYQETSLEKLVDAPVYAARYWQVRQLGSPQGEPVQIDLVADDPSSLTLNNQEEDKLRHLVKETGFVFGSGPFEHYDVIVSLSDVYPSAGGVEHTEEGENNLPANYLTDLPHQLMNRDLIAHEYVHAWNGRYRQPADLWAPTMNEPVRDSMLWVYEGQTEFWSRVLAARSGMRTYQESLDRLAIDAALVENRKGRAWKTLADSNNDPLFMVHHPVPWRDWQRREDYYAEGVLLWLDVDARLREKSKGKYGLDDFARSFFRVGDKKMAVSTYSFEDLCSGLNQLVPDDWAAILRKHLNSHEDSDAMAGLARSGWRLRYSESPSETYKQDEADSAVTNLDYSIGMQVTSAGIVRSVVWDGPAFKAGLAPAARVELINGSPFTVPGLLEAVQGSKTSPVTLTFEVNGREITGTLLYSGRIRYPHLERIPDKQDNLTPLLRARDL